MRRDKIKGIIAAILTSAVLLTGCNSSVNIDPEVTADNVNLSAANVAHGFIQAVFTDDQELFFKCYPESAFALYDEDDNTVYQSYRDVVTADTEYYGIDFTALNDFTEENGYDEETMKDNIAVFHMLDKDMIDQIQLVKERVYFHTPEDKYESTDVYIIVYKMDAAWYMYEMANSDADFAA